MTHKLTLLVTLPIVAGLVAACGGGGGAVPKATQLGAPPPKAQSVIGEGHFFKVPKSSSGAWNVTATTKHSGISIQVPDGPNDYDHYESEAGTLAILKTTTAGPLYHSQYGLIVLDEGNHVAVGGYHAGNLTPLSQMPNNASATYKGSFVGLGGATGYQPEGLFGDTTLQANFGAGTVNGQVSNLQNTDGVSKSYGLSMNGQISGNKYSGTAGFTTLGTPTGSVTSSAMSGGFYGPNASETAGALRVEGTPLVGQRSTAVVGAFGAKKQ